MSEQLQQGREPHPSEPSVILPLNPSDPDAPLIALMSTQSNPELLSMSEEELQALLDRLKSYQQPATLSAKLSAESERKKPSGVKAAKLKALLDL